MYTQSEYETYIKVFREIEEKAVSQIERLVACDFLYGELEDWIVVVGDFYVWFNKEFEYLPDEWEQLPISTIMSDALFDKFCKDKENKQ